MQTQKDNKKNRKLLVIGVTYIFLGVFMYLFSDILLKFYDLRYLSSIELIQIMSITVSLMGVLASFYSFMKGTKREETFHESQNKKLLEYEIISTWRELEGVTNDIAISNNLVENKSVIRFLENENLISEDEKSLLTKFLKLRNSVVHGDQIKLSLQEMRDEIKMVAVLIEKINSRLLPKNK